MEVCPGPESKTDFPLCHYYGGVDGGLLAWEQLSQAMGGYSMWVYRLYATTDAMRWATQILTRVFDEVSVPVVLPYIFTPYLYLLFGRRKTDS